MDEWFEYGGRPYHFRLTIDLSRIIGEEQKVLEVMERVNFYKSLRSHLDRLEFTIQPKDPAILRLGGCAAAHVRFPIPEQADEIRMQGILRAGGSMTPSVRLPVPEDTAAAPVEKVFRTGGQTAVHVTAPVPEQQ